MSRNQIIWKRVVATWRHLTEGAQEARLGQTKTFRKGSEASSRAERRHGCVILVSNEPRCYHAATSERRRIQSRADNNIIALRGASIRRSQRGNSEAVFFRGTLPRRYSIRRSQRGNNSATPHTHFTTFAATPLSTYISCVGTARRSAFAVGQHLDCQATIVVTNSTTSHCRATVIASHSIATTRRALHNRHHLQSTRTPTAHHDCSYFCHHTSTTYKYNIKEPTLCLTLS